jgi:hypothetical protein
MSAPVCHNQAGPSRGAKVVGRAGGAFVRVIRTAALGGAQRAESRPKAGAICPPAPALMASR